MIGIIQKQLTGILRPGSPERRVALFACALVMYCAAAQPAVAQSSKMHAAFADPDENSTTTSNPLASEVRLVSGQQQPAAKPVKPATPPPARKPAAKKASPDVTTKAQSQAIIEELPAGPMKAVLPLAGAPSGDGLDVTLDDKEKGLITMTVRDTPLSQVLARLAQLKQLNIVAANDIDVMISITLKHVPVEDALTAVLAVANYTWVKRGNIILVTSVADSVNLPADVQGRQIQVFDLDFASATNVSETVQNFLSPIGKCSTSVSNHANNRMTQERIVVEDVPESLERIANYIAQIDRPPRQVLLEAHILQVTLDDTTRCGVNLNQLMRISHSNFTVKTVGLANASADSAFLATLDGGDLGGVIEALTTTTDAKTLGSPKLLVLNEQEARLQVGEHLGFKVSTTTDTSTIQNVQFLDVGVVLRLTPRITRDGCVLLHVKPEVSKGAVNPDTGLPESQTAELETDVMLNDGQGMVIGGLIKENDTTNQSKVPWLGNVRGIGWLFRRTEVVKERVEIIVALVPRVQPYDAKYQAYEQGELVNASVPLMHGPLCRTDRPWDPVLPDGKRIKYPLFPPTHQVPKTGYYHDQMPDYLIPPYPMPEQHFYGDAQQCEPSGPQLPDPLLNDPFTSGEELPLPEKSGDSSSSTPILNDQPIALKPTSGDKR
jgi:type IV pilus assembly protein PilQ